MLGVVAFDLTKKYIFAFFLLIYAANYVKFLGYNVMIRNVKIAEGPMLKQRTNLFFIIMNIAYLVNFCLAFTEFFGPWCTPNNLYPPCLTIAALLYWANYFQHLYLQRK